MTNIAVTSTAVMEPANLYSGAMANQDIPIQKAPHKTVSGHIYDVNQNPVMGATVMLFRQDGNRYITSTTTDEQGSYFFLRNFKDTTLYYTLAYTLAGGSVQVHGTSDRGLVPA